MIWQQIESWPVIPSGWLLEAQRKLRPREMVAISGNGDTELGLWTTLKNDYFRFAEIVIFRSN